MTAKQKMIDSESEKRCMSKEMEPYLRRVIAQVYVDETIAKVLNEMKSKNAKSE